MRNLTIRTLCRLTMKDNQLNRARHKLSSNSVRVIQPSLGPGVLHGYSLNLMKDLQTSSHPSVLCYIMQLQGVLLSETGRPLEWVVFDTRKAPSSPIPSGPRKDRGGAASAISYTQHTSRGGVRRAGQGRTSALPKREPTAKFYETALCAAEAGCARSRETLT
ncbi:hypothetical protein NDU88_002221 [Pleurodeles waltl]|uniref:Uncharacterized protein n=1 Tax=Pleurodeles waltl TaxID=8319 RepID=A0AAV7T1L4_PLEWA|nr:hypothetical protein NDU88_002221 [Pleurodeles waltl]